MQITLLFQCNDTDTLKRLRFQKCSLQDTHFTSKKAHRQEDKRHKMIFQACAIQNQEEVSISMFDKIDFKDKNSKR